MINMPRSTARYCRGTIAPVLGTHTTLGNNELLWQALLILKCFKYNSIPLCNILGVNVISIDVRTYIQNGLTCLN